MIEPDSPKTSANTFWPKFSQWLIQWIPLGSSIGLLAHFLVSREWIQALIAFPITIVTVIWSTYTEHFIAQLREIYKERAGRDAKKFVAAIDSINQSIRWQLSGFENRYLKLQADACQEFITEGFNQPPGITIPLLEEVFVPLEISSEFIANRAGDVLPEMPSNKNGRFDSLERRSVPKQIDDLSIWNLIARTKHIQQFKRIAILAWGGYGKTTLLRHITYFYAYKNNQVLDLYVARSVPRYVPVLLPLRQHKDIFHQEKLIDLADVIVNNHLSKLSPDNQLKPPPFWAKTLLERGNALVMFDGFDEIADNGRADASKWILSQMSKYPETTFILTSRPAGYKDFVSPRLSTTVFIKAFNAAQRERFVRKWYLCQEKYARAGRLDKHINSIANRNADDLLAQIEERAELSDMSRTPLLLNMISTFHRIYPSRRLPNRRVLLYQAICQLQLGDRPLARQVELSLSPQENQTILQGLALEMLELNEPQIDEHKILNFISKYLSGLSETVQPSLFLKQMVEVSELLVEREPKIYEFSHLSFQSYLASVQIKKIKRESYLIRNIDKAWWRETALLYAAQTNPSRLLRKLIDLDTRESIALAYDCLKISPKGVDVELETEVERIAEETLEVLRYRESR